MKTLVLGLGNPILSDDGVGIRVAQELKDSLDPAEVTVTEAGVAGLDFLDLLTPYDKAIIIDAIQTREGKPGQVYRLKPEDFMATQHACSPHDVNFATALELGRRLGILLPQEIVVFAVEVENVTTFNERCTPKVAQTVPVVVDMVMRELNGG
ncbi:MAG: hydrogenase maturation protease [Dehalococcoidales bacterium]|nr:MAG: hydrogenase maturation protease [Dehalococcoidales bacterium]